MAHLQLRQFQPMQVSTGEERKLSQGEKQHISAFKNSSQRSLYFFSPFLSVCVFVVFFLFSDMSCKSMSQFPNIFMSRL